MLLGAVLQQREQVAVDVAHGGDEAPAAHIAHALVERRSRDHDLGRLGLDVGHVPVGDGDAAALAACGYALVETGRRQVFDEPLGVDEHEGLRTVAEMTRARPSIRAGRAATTSRAPLPDAGSWASGSRAPLPPA